MKRDRDQSDNDEHNAGVPEDCPVPVAAQDDSAGAGTDREALHLVKNTNTEFLCHTGQNQEACDDEIRRPRLNECHVTDLGFRNFCCCKPGLVPVVLLVECPHFLRNKETILCGNQSDQQGDDRGEQGHQLGTDECSDQEIEDIECDRNEQDVRNYREHIAELLVLAVEFADEADANEQNDCAADRQRKSGPECQRHLPRVKVAAKSTNCVFHCRESHVGRCSNCAEANRHGVVDQSHHCRAKRRETDRDQERCSQRRRCSESCRAFDERAEDEADDDGLQSRVRSDTFEHAVDRRHSARLGQRVHDQDRSCHPY